jgi:hypothetical protein
VLWLLLLLLLLLLLKSLLLSRAAAMAWLAPCTQYSTNTATQLPETTAG